MDEDYFFEHVSLFVTVVVMTLTDYRLMVMLQ